MIHDSNFKTVNDGLKVCLHNARSVRNKTSQIRNSIEAVDFNLIILTIMWIKDNVNDEFHLHQCCPNGYYYLSANRKEKSGGGLALFYDGNVLIIFQTSVFFTNAELAFLEFTRGKSVYLLVCIYRRPNTIVRVFISELTSFIEKVLLFKNLRYQYFYAAIK